MRAKILGAAQTVAVVGAVVALTLAIGWGTL